jgi:hypothetical protein
MGRSAFLKAGMDVCSAATYNSGGRMPINTSSGSRCTSGIPGTNDSPSPATSNTSGATNPSRRASAAPSTEIATSATVSKMPSMPGSLRPARGERA